MKSLRTSLASLALIAVSASLASAAPVAYKIDRSHSEVGFKVRHFFSKTPGRFNEYDGTILWDDKNLAASSVDVTIQSASIYTANERRDNHLKSDDFFSAEKHPTITFKSTKVVPGESGKFQIHGDLTMRGITKPVVLDAELLGAGPLMVGGNSRGTRAGFEATTTVNRKDWEIVWNQTLDQGGTMLDDKVTIELHVEAIKDEPKKDAAAPAAAAPAPTGDKK
jgi:polyisoprenoid-binding protein YceI